MKRLIVYLGFSIAVLIIFISICLTLVKIDLVKMCYFTNTNGESLLFIDKKTKNDINNENIDSCVAKIDNRDYKIKLTYDKEVNDKYQYWAHPIKSDDLPNITNYINCNFGGIIALKLLI